MMDALVTLFITIITAVIVYVGSEIRKNERARTIFNVLEPLAKDAVVAAQKLGVTERCDEEKSCGPSCFSGTLRCRFHRKR